MSVSVCASVAGKNIKNTMPILYLAGALRPPDVTKQRGNLIVEKMTIGKGEIKNATIFLLAEFCLSKSLVFSC